MHAILLSAALILAAQTTARDPAVQPELPQLTLEQSAGLRCAAALALTAEAQAAGDEQALAYPPLDARGKEFFVRVLARIMDETGAGREAITMLLAREANHLAAGQRLNDVMPACLLMLEASGV